MQFQKHVAVVLILTVLAAGCMQQTDVSPPETSPETSPPETTPPETTPPETTETTPPETPAPTEPPQPDKMALWDMKTGPYLRGANIHQRRLYPELDGPEFMGPGPVGPPFTQKDFDKLAALGCNYVNISHPGLFTENPPYTVDKDIQDNLDKLLTMIEKADMFAVISFRTGPGRSEFTFVLEDVGDWFDRSYLNDSVWQDQEAQNAWVAMWEYTADRYKDNPVVAGYDLMVEPNSNETGSSYVYDRLDIWDPEEFYDEYGGTLYDWNQLYPEIIDGIRTVDKDTPILVGGNGYSGVVWLPYVKVVKDKRVVYIAHQYAPHQYTHQYTSIECSYPDTCDIDWDDRKEQFDKAWLTDFLSLIDVFADNHNVPVAVNEFGIVRWIPGAAQFMDDEMGLFEEKGVNYALWEWETSWEPHTEEENAFNFLYGPDPDNTTAVPNELKDVITKYWSHNAVRPSTFYRDSKSFIPSFSVFSSVFRALIGGYWLFISVVLGIKLIQPDIPVTSGIDRKEFVEHNNKEVT